jgi:hypothetical protein
MHTEYRPVRRAPLVTYRRQRQTMLRSTYWRCVILRPRRAAASKRIRGLRSASAIPRRKKRRLCCPLPACANKRIDAAHRSPTVSVESGAWHCWRCGAAGKLQERWVQLPARPRNRSVATAPGVCSHATQGGARLPSRQHTRAAARCKSQVRQPATRATGSFARSRLPLQREGV